MNEPIYEVVVGESLPDLSVWVEVDHLLLTDLASNATFRLLVRTAADDDDLILKTTGFTGQTGSGTATTGTPNLVIAWAKTGELDTLTPDRTHKALLTITRTSDQKVRYYNFLIRAIAQN